MFKIPQKLKIAIQDPDRAYFYIRNKCSLIPYHLGDGSHSFYPSTIYISVNSICNLRCKMCDVGQNNKKSQFYANLKIDGKKEELSVVRLKKLADEVKNFRPRIHIISTEPLLWGDLKEFSNYVINSGLKLSITTNGYLLKKFADDFVKMGLPQLWVSLDGPANIHNEIRGVSDSFERACAGIELINEMKNKMQRKYPKINISYCISNHNYYCLEDFMSEISTLGIKRINFSHLNYVTPDMADMHNKKFGHVCKTTQSSVSMVNPLEVNIKALAKQIKNIKAKYSNKCVFIPDLDYNGLEIYYRNPNIFVGKTKCVVPWHSAQIIANGDVIPLARCFNIKLGNIYQQSFKEIWNGEKMREFRRILKLYRAFPACSRCCGVL